MTKIVTMELVGFVEYAPNGAIVGWMYDRRTTLPVVLRVIIDGCCIGTVTCDKLRPDVGKSGYSRNNVGFRFEMPAIYWDGKPHTVEFYTKENEQIICRGKDGGEQFQWIFNLSPEYLVTSLDRWVSGDIHCWAVVVDRITEIARPADYVIVQQSGRSVATLFPTISRPDVAARYGSDALCGFMFPEYRLGHLSDASPLHFYVHPDGQEINGSPLIIGNSKLSHPALAHLDETHAEESDLIAIVEENIGTNDNLSISVKPTSEENMDVILEVAHPEIEFGEAFFDASEVISVVNPNTPEGQKFESFFL